MKNHLSSASGAAAEFNCDASAEPVTHYAAVSNTLSHNILSHKQSGADIRSEGSSWQDRDANPLQTKQFTDEVSLISQNQRQFDHRDTKLNKQINKRATSGGAVDQLTGTVHGSALVAADSPPVPTRAVGLPYPGRLLQYIPGALLRYDAAVQQWQERMQERGWSIQTDGLYGQESRQICRQFQQAKRLPVDGIVGPQTWAATFKNDVKPSPSSSSAAQINSRGLQLVKNSEGLSLRAYRDPVGIWTIGYGHTGPEVGPGDVITKAEAESLLKRDLTRFERAVKTLVKVPLNTNQFSALVSFTYNVGTGALAESTLLRLLNQRDYQGAANQFSRWVYGDGQVLPGLVTRRNAEKNLFLTPA